MIGTPAGQFLVITHSADLVPTGNADDLAGLVRLENETGQTRAHRFDQASLAREDITRITRESGLSADAVSLLFARESSWWKAKPDRAHCLSGLPAMPPAAAAGCPQISM